MNQEILVEALGKQLDALQTVFNSLILLAVVITWAGISHQTEIEALTIKFKRRHAFFVASALYLIANATVCILFYRIRSLIMLLDPSHLISGFSMVVTHSWVLNPFSYFGSELVPRIYSAGGIGLLIFTWWVCNASLEMLDDKQHPFASKVMMGGFQLLGVLSLAGMVGVVQDFELRGKAIALIGDQFRYTMLDRIGGALVGFGLGALAVKAMKRAYERWTVQRSLELDVDPPLKTGRRR